VPESRIEVAIDDAAAPLALDDPTAVEHLLMNVLGNAVEASGPGSGHRAAITARRDGEALHIVIHDGGAGVTAEPVPFTSTKPEGLGLGLLLSRMLVERRGGSLRLGRDAIGGRVDIVLPQVTDRGRPA
jgi:C4-dicarboxylate-specific signal transduction histidine kinase